MVRSSCEQRSGREYEEPGLLICAASETLAGLDDQDLACCASAGARACGEMEKKGGGGGWCGKMKRNLYDGGLFSERDADVGKREVALRQPPSSNPRVQRSQRLERNDINSAFSKKTQECGGKDTDMRLLQTSPSQL